MRAQDAPVLSDVDENNFDRACDHFRPSEYLCTVKQARIDIIQGKVNTQMSKKLSEAEQRDKSIDFCANAFAPSEPDER